MGLLDGRVAMVTGAGHNIGRAIALRFADEGASVVVVDLDPARGEAVRDEVASRSGHAIAIVADVSDEGDVDDAVSRALAEFGQIDILVNNVAATVNKTMLETSLAEWELVQAVTLRSTFLCCRAVARSMIDAGRPGAIVNIASTSGHRGNIGKFAYGVAKGGVLNLTRAAAMELAPHGIRVNSLTPTQTGSPLGIAGAPAREGPTTSIPLGRFGKPEDQAAAALFLASDESSFVTGAELVCDGGLLAVFPKG